MDSATFQALNDMADEWIEFTAGLKARWIAAGFQPLMAEQMAYQVTTIMSANRVSSIQIETATRIAAAHRGPSGASRPG